MMHERDERAAEPAMAGVNGGLDDLFEAAPVAIHWLDADGTILRANRCELELLGYAREEYEGHHISEFHIDPDLIADMLERLARGEGLSGCEARLRAKDGSVKHVLVSSNARPQEGTLLHTRSFTHDLTERKQAEEALRESEERYALAEEGANDGLWDLDLVAGETYHSPIWKRQLGYEDHELESRYEEFSERLHPDDRERVNAALDAYIVGDAQRYALEQRLRHKDGSYRWIHSRALCVRDENGKALRMTGWNTDITERKQAEEALRKSEERYALAAEGANDGLWDRDLVSGDVYISPIWKRQLGYEDHELESRMEEWESRLHPDERERILAINEDFLEGTDDRFELEYRLRHRDGSYRWIDTRALCVRDENGKVLRMTGWNTDVTERKRLEEQLLQSQKMEAVGQLAGGIAHDFNNLLTVLGGYGEALVRRLADDEVLRADAEVIVETVGDASSLTQQLLAFSSQRVVASESVDVNGLVVDLERMLGRLLGEEIELASVLDPDAGCVPADPGQLKQVLVNLAVNARDAMPAGGRLKITTGSVELDADGGARLGLAPGRYATLVVADTGVGIDEAIRERLFEPFFTTKAPGEGTGLGLASVYGTVSAASGAIDVESEPGRGAAFTVYLPQLAENETADEQAPLGASVERAGADAGTVMLVEDNDRVRALVQRTLSEAGYRALAVAGAEEALAFANDHPGPIDALVTDMVMPGLGGLELAERLLAERPNMRVLLISGYTPKQLAPEGFTGEVKFLAKPFSPEQLTSALHHTLNTQQAHAARS